MPKVSNTRKQRAAELLRRLADGPAFRGPSFVDEVFTTAKATEQFRLWCRSWILPEVKQLVPELRGKSQQPTTTNGGSNG